MPRKNLTRKLTRLVSASIALNAALDTDRVLEHLLNTATEVLECAGASILLFDEREQQLYFVAATGREAESLKRIPVPLEGSIAGEVFRSGKPLVVHDAQNDPRHYRKAGKATGVLVRNLIAVPLLSRGMRIGVLEGVNKHEGAFTDLDVHLAQVLAAQAAVALHNARMMAELHRAYETSERANRMKEEFLALASHELRTPLGVVLGYASLLRESVQDKDRQLVNAILQAALQMRSIIEQMSLYTALEEGKTVLEERTFPLQKVLHPLAVETRRLAEAKDITLVATWPEASLWVRGDEKKLHAVFKQLLSNALRFTPQGGRITLRARAHPGEVRVEVEDTGPGIPFDELEAIFDEFHQVEHHLVRKHGGLGLGLSIARGLVRLHGGRIWAESEGPDQGATFIVVLPAAKPPAQAKA